MLFSTFVHSQSPNHRKSHGIVSIFIPQWVAQCDGAWHILVHLKVMFVGESGGEISVVAADYLHVCLYHTIFCKAHTCIYNIYCIHVCALQNKQMYICIYLFIF